MRRLLQVTARPVELLLGAFFVFAALLKVQHPGLFAVQIYEYHVLQNKDLLGFAALFFITLEIGLGIALFLDLRPRLLTLVVAQGMLVFFTGLILYAWTFHGLKDCGCMGEVRMGPGVSILKNVVMMACVAWSWLGYRHQQPAPETTGRIVDKWAAALAVAGVALGASYIELYKKSPATSEQTNETAAADETSAPRAPGPFSRYVIESEIGERFDLSRGTYLVALLSATCDHCMASVPTLNEYLLRPDVLPPLVGLCYEPSPGALEEFRILTGMAFPCYNLGNDFLTFVKFIGREPPRLSLVRDGTAVHSWDDEMPAADALIAWLERETGGAEPAAEAPPVFE